MRFVDFHIVYLADCPETIPTLARWFYEQWGHLVPERTIKQNEGQLWQRINRNKIPLTLVAFSGEQPVGSASLKIQEMDTHKHFINWLGNVYVLPEYRNRGIGSALVRRAVEEATRLSVKDLYLHTPDKENMYSRLGWTAIERTHYRGLDVVIMKRRLSAKPEH